MPSHSRTLPGGGRVVLVVVVAGRHTRVSRDGRHRPFSFRTPALSRRRDTRPSRRDTVTSDHSPHAPRTMSDSGLGTCLTAPRPTSASTGPAVQLGVPMFAQRRIGNVHCPPLADILASIPDRLLEKCSAA